MQTLSSPLHICCVCFSELFKRRKTKSKEKGREGERVQGFHFCFSFFSISSADLANRPIVLLYSLVLFSFAAVVFYLFPPSLLPPSSFISVRVFFRRVLRGCVKPPFHCPTLFFFVTVPHAGLGNSRGQKSRGTSVQMQKNVKWGRTEGKKQTNNERWVYLRREDKGGKEKVFLMGESRSADPSRSLWQSNLGCSSRETRKADERSDRRQSHVWVEAIFVFLWVTEDKKVEKARNVHVWEARTKTLWQKSLLLLRQTWNLQRFIFIQIT